MMGATAWGNGLGAPQGLGCCMLRGCCGIGDAVGHGWFSMMGAAVPTPGRARWQVAMAVGGHGGSGHCGE